MSILTVELRITRFWRTCNTSSLICGRSAKNYSPLAIKYLAFNCPIVSVAVLFVIISNSDPAFSTAFTFFISKLSLRSESTLNTIANEIARGRPSGTPTITRAMAI